MEIEVGSTGDHHNRAAPVEAEANSDGTVMVSPVWSSPSRGHTKNKTSFFPRSGQRFRPSFYWKKLKAFKRAPGRLLPFLFAKVKNLEGQQRCHKRQLQRARITARLECHATKTPIVHAQRDLLSKVGNLAGRVDGVQEEAQNSSKCIQDLGNSLTQLSQDVGSSQQQQLALLTSIDENLQHLGAARWNGQEGPCHLSLEEQLEGERQEVHRLEDELSTCKAMLQDARSHLEVKRLEKGPCNFANPHKISDPILQSKWKELRFGIRDLAYFLSTAKPNCHLDPTVTRFMAQSSLQYEEMLNHEEGRCEIYQAYLWRLIVKQVFQGTSATWKTDLRVQLQEFKNSALDSASPPKDKNLEIFMKWLSEGGNTLNEMNHDDNAAVIAELVGEILKPVCSLIVEPRRKSAASLQVEENLQDILGTALELHAMMLTSRSILSVHWPMVNDLRSGRCIRYKHRYMESENFDNDQDEINSVSIVISPCLLKMGTADGRDYSKSKVLVKAMVLCD